MAPAIFAFAVVGMVLLIATRNGASLLNTKPRTLRSLSTTLDARATFKAILKFATKTGYEVEAFDEENGRLVLSDRPTITTWGFFYPIFISTVKERQTLVEIGIKSRLIQVGPLVTRKHSKCCDGIKSAISAT